MKIPAQSRFQTQTRRSGFAVNTQQFVQSPKAGETLRLVLPSRMRSCLRCLSGRWRRCIMQCRIRRMPSRLLAVRPPSVRCNGGMTVLKGTNFDPISKRTFQ